jgi:hypothetical protein
MRSQGFQKEKHFAVNSIFVRDQKRECKSDMRILLNPKL